MSLSNQTATMLGSLVRSVYGESAEELGFPADLNDTPAVRQWVADFAQVVINSVTLQVGAPDFEAASVAVNKALSEIKRERSPRVPATKRTATPPKRAPRPAA